MQNPLFLHFCFWLLGEKCQSEYKSVACPNRQMACKALYLYIFELIHGKQLNLRNVSETYPAIDLHDEVCLEHLGKVLEMFDDIKCFSQTHDLPVEWSLDHMQHSYKTLKVFTVEDENLESQNAMLPHLTRCKDSDNLLNIILSIDVHKSDLVKSFCDSQRFSEREVAVFYMFTDPC